MMSSTQRALAAGLLGPIFWAPIFFLPAAGAFLAGCKDDAKLSAQKAAASQLDAAKLSDDNMAKVSAGLAQGATKLTSLYANGADPHEDPQAVRAALFQNRRDVVELNVAKTTFSALLDDKGVAIRNDLEQDSMAGKNLFTVFPGLKTASTGFVTATGAFEPAPPPAPADRTWVAGVPVKKADGSFAGVYITGWSYRQYAFQLQDVLRKRLADDLEKAKSVAKPPIFYVMLFDATGVYGTPLTPSVNETKLKELDLVAKTASGPVQGVVGVDDRDYGYGAARAPSLGADIGIAVMRSEL